MPHKKARFEKNQPKISFFTTSEKENLWPIIIKSNGPLGRGMPHPPGPKTILSNLLQYNLFLSLLYVNHVYKLDQRDGNIPCSLFSLASCDTSSSTSGPSSSKLWIIVFLMFRSDDVSVFHILLAYGPQRAHLTMWVWDHKELTWWCGCETIIIKWALYGLTPRSSSGLFVVHKLEICEKHLHHLI
jgi:hypothetical protein